MEVMELLAKIATILGIPLAIILSLTKKAKRDVREYGTYDASADKYIDYLRLCMENPELDLYDIPLEKKIALSPGTKNPSICHV
ncbi:MAG: hypothetical protein IPJ94_19630 [Chloroflexi bacterium]|nr:hypothetical protein [Chloroflexota bacterium]